MIDLVEPVLSEYREAVVRFMDKVVFEPASGCWLWSGSAPGFGYGKFYFDGEVILAHRFIAQAKNGKLHRKTFVCHRCDQPNCVNPDHLFLGSAKENTQDMVNKRRAKPRNVDRMLSDEEVGHIRERAMIGLDYARLYGVSKSVIYRIQSGRHYLFVKNANTGREKNCGDCAHNWKGHCRNRIASRFSQLNTFEKEINGAPYRHFMNKCRNFEEKQ